MEASLALSYDFDFGLFDIDELLDEGERSLPRTIRSCLCGIPWFSPMMTPLAVGRDRSIKAVEAAMGSDNLLVVVAQRDPEIQKPEMEDLYTIGVEMVVGRILRMPDGTTNILGQGRRRVRILGLSQTQPYIRARIQPLDESSKRHARHRGPDARRAVAL